MTSPETCDVLVVGGGILGLAAAREAKRRRPKAKVVLLEKEDAPGRHASGRNSGVLHAGFYYSPDGLKARLCREGNAALSAWCLERGLPYAKRGKLVVASGPEDLPRLEELLRRGKANGVRLEKLDAAAAREAEPRAKVFEAALWSPDTAVVDPGAVVASLAADAKALGVELRLGRAWRRGDWDAGAVINAAGLQADRVAAGYGFGASYALVPFRGFYLYSDEAPGAFRALIYPVPDPAFPFLGVHVTVDVHGRAKLGPNALPGFWREQYGGLAGFSAGELFELLPRHARIAAGSAAVGAEEAAKATRAGMVSRAARLASGLTVSAFRRWGPTGIRAQLVERASGALVHDFVVEGDDRSVHALNAVSPGFTCALPFAALLADRLKL
ncbi:MAG: L-2-hydroxyglutarate oxidase [Elusimicrobiota bacterium]|nr:L-2-hydroxyglutarate oxidase [Elusimicrobiota bacterium]